MERPDDGRTPPTVHIVGLGPGDIDLVTAGTMSLLGSVPRQFVRTRRHPAASLLDGAPSFDHVYDSADTIDEVYPSIVEELVAAAFDAGEVLYAVPGSPLVAEHTVELLLADDRVRTVAHPALSFLDLTWVRLGVDPVETGARLVDGHRFEVAAAGERGPLLVAQCDSRFVLSDIKLAVEQAPEEPVTVLQRLGLPDEVVRQVDWWDLDREVEPDHLTSLWIPRMAAPVGAGVAALVELMVRLRDQDPWKAQQDHQSLKRYLLEESYEVLEAIDAYDPMTGEGADELCSELGDLLYQVVFHSAIASESGWFTLADVAGSIHDKLVRRHPHVNAATRTPDTPAAPDTPGGSGAPAAPGAPGGSVLPDAPGAPGGSGRTDAAPPSVDELVVAWEADKQREHGRDSVMDGIPSAMPALARAMKVAKRAAALGDASPTPAPPPPGAAPALSVAPAPLDDTQWDAETLGAALLKMVDRATASDLDPEDALRVATDRRIAELRRAERGRAGT